MAAVVLDSERMVESVTAAEKIWEQTFNAIGEGILVHDAAGTILHCNARAAEMMETDTAHVIGRRLEEAFARMFGKRAADYYLRQLRDWKYSAEIEGMNAAAMTGYGRMCGWTLARAPARTGDRVAIAA